MALLCLGLSVDFFKLHRDLKTMSGHWTIILYSNRLCSPVTEISLIFCTFFNLLQGLSLEETPPRVSSARILIQASVISKLDYCNSLLTGLPACALKPHQLIQNAAGRLVFNQPKFFHVTPLRRSLHWLPVTARTARTVYKTLMLAYKATKGTISPTTPPAHLDELTQGR